MAKGQSMITPSKQMSFQVAFEEVKILERTDGHTYTHPFYGLLYFVQDYLAS